MVFKRLPNLVFPVIIGSYELVQSHSLNDGVALAVFHFFQDDEDEDEADEEEGEGGLSKSGKELKKLLRQSNGLDNSDEDDDDDDDDVCSLIQMPLILFQELSLHTCALVSLELWLLKHK